MRHRLPHVWMVLARLSPIKEETMTNRDEQKIEKSGNLAMWITTAVIILVLVGGMGINYLMHRDTNTGPTDTSSQEQSR